MRTYLAGLLVLAALTTLTSSVEAGGRRCGGGSCGVFQNGIFQHAQCGSGGCSGGVVGTPFVQATTWTPTTQAAPESAEYIPQPQIMRVTDSQGKIYYLVPQNQYEKLAAPK